MFSPRVPLPHTFAVVCRFSRISAASRASVLEAEDSAAATAKPAGEYKLELAQQQQQTGDAGAGVERKRGGGGTMQRKQQRATGTVSASAAGAAEEAGEQQQVDLELEVDFASVRCRSFCCCSVDVSFASCTGACRVHPFVPCSCVLAPDLVCLIVLSSQSGEQTMQCEIAGLGGVPRALITDARLENADGCLGNGSLLTTWRQLSLDKINEVRARAWAGLSLCLLSLLAASPLSILRFWLLISCLVLAWIAGAVCAAVRGGDQAECRLH